MFNCISKLGLYSKNPKTKVFLNIGSKRFCDWVLKIVLTVVKLNCALFIKSKIIFIPDPAAALPDP